MTDKAYLSSRSTRKLWYLLKGYYGDSPDKTFIVKEIRYRRDNPSKDVWPDCDSPSMDSKYIKKHRTYKSVRW